jgi:damage-control phosphatase, subfamily I
MKADFECIPCILTQGINTVRKVTDDRNIHRDVINYIMDRLRNTELSMTPADHSNLAYEAVREVTGVQDPYKDEKHDLNRAAMELYPKLKQIVAESDNPLHTALKIAVAGNMIDLGIAHKFDIKQDLKQIIEEGFAINDYADFKSSLDRSDRILYIGDNTGEIVFDKVLIEELGPEKITFVVKGGPIINDATLEDAQQIGLDKICRIISTADNSIGLPPSAMTSEIKECFNKAGTIISKGHGNFETLSETNNNIFFLLKAKCTLVAKELGVKFGQVVLVHQQHLPNKTKS